jgi:hypothetical protein
MKVGQTSRTMPAERPLSTRFGHSVQFMVLSIISAQYGGAAMTASAARLQAGASSTLSKSGRPRGIFFALGVVHLVLIATLLIAALPMTTANAAPPIRGVSPTPHNRSAPSMTVAPEVATVICTRVEGRHLHRRVQGPQNCIEEVIDTSTGTVVSRKTVPCDPQC